MRISFAGDCVGFGIRSSSVDYENVDERETQISFNLHPRWTDLTPAFDPTGKASELDLLQDAGIDISLYSVALDWRPGTSIDASKNYSKLLHLLGHPKPEIEDCRTVLSVLEKTLYVTCFIPEDVYDAQLKMCEGFASWPNPKGYYGRMELPILHKGLLAALNATDFLAFWAGELPLYSDRWIEFGVFQNREIPAPPTDEEKSRHHLSQV